MMAIRDGATMFLLLGVARAIPPASIPSSDSVEILRPGKIPPPDMNTAGIPEPVILFDQILIFGIDKNINLPSRFRKLFS
jgi:hypothetical protein